MAFVVRDGPTGSMGKGKSTSKKKMKAGFKSQPGHKKSPK